MERIDVIWLHGESCIKVMWTHDAQSIPTMSSKSEVNNMEKMTGGTVYRCNECGNYFYSLKEAEKCYKSHKLEGSR